MNIPEKFTITDIVNYLFFGALLFLVCFGFSLDVRIIDIEFVTNAESEQWLFAAFILPMLYYIGVGSRIWIPVLLKWCYTKKSRFCCLALLMRKTSPTDLRVLSNLKIETSDLLIAALATDFDIRKEEVLGYKSSELFYTVTRLLEVHNASRRVDRLHYITNATARIHAILALSLILAFVALIVGIFSDTLLSTCFHSAILIIIFFVFFVISRHLVRNLELWWKNVWRSYLAIRMPIKKRSQQDIDPNA